MKKSVKLAIALVATISLSQTMPIWDVVDAASLDHKFANMVPVGLDKNFNAKQAKENQPYKKPVVQEARFNLNNRIHQSNKNKQWNPVQLPEKIDPRGTFLETPVRDQGQQGLCWAYSSTDVLAINHRKQTGKTVMYSPNFLNYTKAGNSFNVGEDPADYNKDSASSNPTAEWWPSNSGYLKLGDGGNALLVVDDLQVHQVKPVDEADFISGLFDSAHNDVYGFADLAETPMAYDSYLGAKALADQSYDIKNVEGVQALQDISGNSVAEHTQKIKTLVAQYGAATLSINGYLLFPNFTKDAVEGNVYNNDNNAINVPFNYASETNGKITVTYRDKPYTTNVFGSNHQVTIVGYDDNYSADNFNPEVRPASNGAFLVKNSWGTSAHDGGYFWLSYEAGTLAVNDIMSFQLGAHTDHKVAQNSQAAAGYDVEANAADEYTGKAFIAETFDAAIKDRFVTDVNVSLAGENSTYKLSVIDGDLNLGTPIQDEKADMDFVAPYSNLNQNVVKTVTGSTKFAFEHKVPLNYNFKAGHKYTVVVEETAPDLNTEMDFVLAATAYATKDQVAGQSYFGVINDGKAYSIDMHDSPTLAFRQYDNIVAQNNISLDYK
ncbi:MAG: C1 family peptidase [Lactobacillales bacterium]|jgi:C1A family cysteine protease|nr:C1 family peptidase [Lactobacillales bacterium]